MTALHSQQENLSVTPPPLLASYDTFLFTLFVLFCQEAIQAHLETQVGYHHDSVLKSLCKSYQRFYAFNAKKIETFT